MKLFWAGAWKVGMAGTLTVLLVGMSLAAAPPVDKETPLPPAFAKKAPETVEDLRAIQDRVKAVLKKTMPAVVAIIIPDPFGRVAAGSGVIVSADGFVMTAGHISQTPGEKCFVILENGKRLEGKTLGWHKKADAGLIKLNTKAKLPFLEKGDSSKLTAGDWCLTVGHPGGYKFGRPPVVRLGRILRTNSDFIQTDTPLVGGDSGGPLFDMHGKVIGIHSWISERIEQNMHVPANTYRDTWDRLAKGDSWGTPLDQKSQAYLGVAFDPDSSDLKITEVYKGNAAAKAGLKAGDVLLRVDNRKLARRTDLMRYLEKKEPGEEVTVEAQRDGKTIKFKVTLARRGDE
jgi:serine protease Do